MKTAGNAGRGVGAEEPLWAIINNKQGEQSDDPDQRAVDLYIELRAYYDLYLKTSNERHLDYSKQLRDSLLNILAKPDRADLPLRFIGYHEEVARLKLKRK